MSEGINQVQTNVGPVYRWRLGINDEHLPMGIKNFNTSQILIFGGISSGENLCIPKLFFWVDTILNHNDTGTYLPKHEGLDMIYRPERY